VYSSPLASIWIGRGGFVGTGQSRFVRFIENIEDVFLIE